MIVPDINLLVYAYDNQSSFHPKARDWWEQVLSDSELVGLPIVVALGFIRLTTSSKAVSLPITPELALDTVRSWTEQDNVRWLQPGPMHLDLLHPLLDGRGGSHVTDAHLAALAIEHRATVHTHDRDFERFPGLRVRYPLSG